MRVGILTFHDVANPGAFLQTYATMKTLTEMGHEAVVIDYAKPTQRYNPWTFPLLHPRSCITHPRDAFARNRLERAYSECQKYLCKTRRFMARHQVGSERFDRILVGSDIVWNYERGARGRDPVYFGEHLNAPRIVAFAPSCGSLDLDRPIPAYVRKGLPRFHAIAVRDVKTMELVARVTGHRPSMIADPTFDLRLETLPEVYTFEPDYLLVYALRHTIDSDIQQALRAFAERKKLRIVAVCYTHQWADENHVANPFEWVGRIRCAPFVFTTAFHGAIFSMRLGKPFCLMYTPLMESKIRPMIETLGRQDRVCGEPGQLADVLETPWDVSATQRAMDAMADVARKYLEEALA